MTTLMWFRNDLRLIDNPALQAALEIGSPLICLYIYETNRARSLGGASKWWLHYSLKALDEELKKRGSCLLIRQGEAQNIFENLLKETEIKNVFWNRRFIEDGIHIDKSLKTWLKSKNINAKSFKANLLVEPQLLLQKSGAPYKVFSYFWKSCQEHIQIIKTPQTPSIIPHHLNLDSLPLEKLNLLPQGFDWTEGLNENWQPGEKGALKKWQAFLTHGLRGYTKKRDFPSFNSTSMLSPHLHFGEISINQILQDLEKICFEEAGLENDKETFLRELGWRDFSTYLLYHFPHIVEKPLRPQFENFQWNIDHERLKAWQKGKTGYPIVDAGMRQLWQTGWMHNRVRMIVASFLIKDLLIHWKEGESWFWDTLVDADEASNAASFQWVAGSGVDAAPYFRIFNPVLQSEKFDPQGHYIKQYIPELKDIPEAYIHKPWCAPSYVLKQAQVQLGLTYPLPCVDHDKARKIALDRYKDISKKEGEL